MEGVGTRDKAETATLSRSFHEWTMQSVPCVEGKAHVRHDTRVLDGSQNHR